MAGSSQVKMPWDGGGSPHDLVVQTWIMYTITIILYLLRVFARYKRIGFKWTWEDAFMALAVCWYTAFAVTNIAIAQGGGSSLYLPGQFVTFTPQDIRERVRGSKIEFASENCMLNTLYTSKACMFFIYFQLTLNLKQHLFVKICAGYTFCGWLATVLVLFLNCHPLSGYWTLPPPQEECASYFRYEVTQAVFNISSDIFILSIVLPMVFRVQMPWKTKLPLLFVFSMGIVVVLCACTSKYFTFYDIWDTSYQFWYLREASISLYVTNLPYVWALARKTYRVLRTAENGTNSRYFHGTYDSGIKSNLRARLSNVHSSRSRAMGRLYDLGTANDRPGASEENIIEMVAWEPGTDELTKSDASETTSWATKAGGRVEDDAGDAMKDHGIRKTTEIIVRQDIEQL